LVIRLQRFSAASERRCNCRIVPDLAISVPLSGSVGGVPVIGAALNSQKATEFVSTELVWRFNWFGR
jgi:hypothetical protein